MAGKIKGYTTLEILMVLAMLSILGALFVREFLIYIQRERLKSAASEIASEINFIRTRSMISNAIYGFCYDNDTQTFIFFEDKDGVASFNNNTDNVIKSIKISDRWKGVSVGECNPCLICRRAIVFDRRGEIASVCEGNFTLVNSYGEAIRIIINKLGRISLLYGS